MDRRKFLSYLGVSGALLSLNQCSPKHSSHPWRMLFLTDFHVRADRNVPEALDLLAQKVNALNPDFILGGGDCIHGGFSGDTEISRERFKLFQNFIKKINAPARWRIGNHDFVAAVDSQGNILSENTTAMFKDMLGVSELYQHFREGGHSFICLQSVQVTGGEQPYRGFIDEVQMQWLRQTLAAIPKEEPIVLFSHIPLRTTFMQALYGSMSALPSNLVVENANEVLDLFKNRNLPLVLQGHLHINEQITWNETTFVMAGAVSGAWWNGSNRGSEEGFGKLEWGDTVTDRYQYMDYGWSVGE